MLGKYMLDSLERVVWLMPYLALSMVIVLVVLFFKIRNQL